MGVFSATRVGLFRVVLSLLILILAGAGVSSLLTAQDRNESPPPEFIGDRPALLTESEITPTLSTPQDLLRSILEARARKDLSALARCSSLSADRVELNALDGARASRDFFESSEILWSAFRDRFRDGEGIVETRELTTLEGIPPVEARGFLIAPMPDTSAGEFRLPLVRIRGNWLLEVAP